jgi:hypothetical protein
MDQQKSTIVSEKGIVLPSLDIRRKPILKMEVISLDAVSLPGIEPLHYTDRAIPPLCSVTVYCMHLRKIIHEDVLHGISDC